MTAQGYRRAIRAVTVRSLGVTVGLMAAAATLASPVHADLTSDFTSALDGAGIPYDNQDEIASLGQSLCPMLDQPGASLAGLGSQVLGNSNGMSPAMASMFANIAISTFCPQAVSSLAGGISGTGGTGGTVPALPQLPGLPSL